MGKEERELMGTRGNSGELKKEKKKEDGNSQLSIVNGVGNDAVQHDQDDQVKHIDRVDHVDFRTISDDFWTIIGRFWGV